MARRIGLKSCSHTRERPLMNVPKLRSILVSTLYIWDPTLMGHFFRPKNEKNWFGRK